MSCVLGAVSSGRPSVVDGLRTVALKLEFGVSHNQKFDRFLDFDLISGPKFSE